MRINFESFSALQYRNRALASQVEEFKSGEKYVKMAADYKKLLDFHNKKIKRMERELAKAHSEAVTVRKYWGEVMDDLDKEHQEETARLLAKIGRLEKENLELARQRDEAKDKLKERTRQYYEAATELEEERGKNKKLTAQVNKDFENSSIPSSKQKTRKKKIPNSREKTGKKPGGQPGHEGHTRKQHTPDVIYEIPAPPEYTDNPDYYETGKIIRKQKVSVVLNVQVRLMWRIFRKNRAGKNRNHKKLMSSPVMNVDFTNASVNGKSAQVLVLASPSADVALYIGKENKGHKGVEGTPLENYVGTVVHDHDLTFYKYGTNHQECTQHDIRYLIGSIQNETELEWNAGVVSENAPLPQRPVRKGKLVPLCCLRI